MFTILRLQGGRFRKNGLNYNFNIRPSVYINRLCQSTFLVVTDASRTKLLRQNKSDLARTAGAQRRGFVILTELQ
jgi:hypothetical protein